MEMREMLKELVKENLTEDLLTEAVSEYVDNNMTYTMRDLIVEETRLLVSEKANELVTKTFNEILNAPVTISSGWETETYDSFEKFLLTELKEKLTKDWNIRTQVERMLNEKWDKTVKKIVADFTKDELEKRAMKIFAEDIDKEQK